LQIDVGEAVGGRKKTSRLGRRMFTEDDHQCDDRNYKRNG
jgi:hypothetical protein